ncbi:NHL domain-containing protein [Striga asiatica]|uniref:NHL domain-containing protein n=1 Tax=Striga asiatica TaxID=4170 RepID=A0A5A7PHW3_STRAF|nr:NHL domain-containing protein [Striga asiatica]
MMAPSWCYTFAFVFFTFLHFRPTPAQGDGGKLIFEDGYTVTTVLDGDKTNLKVNPHSIHQRSDNFILLDSVASTFYTVLIPSSSNETVIKKLTGNGEPGYLDGGLDSARFNKPRSFAVDYNGNVYLADQRSIRKITSTGVTTIAGGFSQKAGRKDGPGRDASFSDDLELTFVPKRCALMISDHGNRLVRQIYLKEGDCTKHSGSGKHSSCSYEKLRKDFLLPSYLLSLAVLGTTSAWILGLLLSSLLGLIVGLVIRPYLILFEGHTALQSSWTWTHCPTNLGRQIVMLCYGIKSAVVNSKTVFSLSRQMIILSLSQLSLILRPWMVKPRGTREKTVSLMDLDELSSDYSSSSFSNNVMVSPEVDAELKDLLTFDGREMVLTDGLEEQENGESVDVLLNKHNKIDGMIRDNLFNFEEQARNVRPSVECGSVGLVKRR